MLIRANKLLPNAHKRICTADLKVETAARFARTRIGWWRPRPHSILGIRHDEPQRWGKALWEECRTVYPLVDAKVSVRDVERFWSEQPFDLEIHRDLGNCDLCFLKGRWKLMRLITQHPERADWWIEQERFRRSVARTVRKPELTRFPDALHLRGPEEHAHDAVRRTVRGTGSERGRVLLLRRLS